ncbi:MAG TPA: EAL domain-containing protein, partial [Accumulibacter sp.]
IENHPLAVDLGEWVIARALEQIAAWRAAGLEMAVSVHIGARQLQQAGFVERLAEILAGQPEVEPGRLDLELRETRALKDLASVCAIITACRKIGVSFALDDFACGHSSLTYLKSLPVSRINIDRSFVCDLFEGGENRAILEGVIGLATAFRRQIVAEGVENVEQGRMLLQLGCENVQGDGIARPMPAADLVAWVVAWQREAGVAKPASPRTLATTDPS